MARCCCRMDSPRRLPACPAWTAAATFRVRSRRPPRSADTNRSPYCRRLSRSDWMAARRSWMPADALLASARSDRAARRLSASRASRLMAEEYARNCSGAAPSRPATSSPICFCASANSRPMAAGLFAASPASRRWRASNGALSWATDRTSAGRRSDCSTRRRADDRESSPSRSWPFPLHVGGHWRPLSGRRLSHSESELFPRFHRRHPGRGPSKTTTRIG